MTTLSSVQHKDLQRALQRLDLKPAQITQIFCFTPPKAYLHLSKFLAKNGDYWRETRASQTEKICHIYIFLSSDQIAQFRVEPNLISRRQQRLSTIPEETDQGGWGGPCFKNSRNGTGRFLIH